jgi:ectoine hydroxylase-related dioxygenase (phytanoyl-CoA dioxygenase family)
MRATTEGPITASGGATALLEQYQQDGYVILADAVEIAALREALETLRSRQSHDQLARSDRYNPQGEVDFTKIPNLAKTLEEFRALASAPAVVQAVEALIGQRALIFRDVVVSKPARAGASLDFHQDSAYWDVEPRELISAWFTFRDVGPRDGCLRVVSGSHKRDYAHEIRTGGGRPLPGWVTSGLRRLASLSGTGDSDASGFSAVRRLKNAVLGEFTRRVSFVGKLQDLHACVPEEEQRRAVDLPVRAGSVVLFHSRLLHASGPNTSDLDRPAYIASYMGSEYTFCGVGQPEFLVAGELGRKVFQKARVAKS